MIEILNAALWRLGGAGCLPFKRHWRRIGYPALLLVCLLSRGMSPLMACFVAIMAHLTTRLPLTFIGNSLHDHWFNWIWVWIAGYILGLPSVLIYGWMGFLFSLVTMAVQGVFITLSNIQEWPAKSFTHDFCEGMVGIAIIKVLL